MFNKLGIPIANGTDGGHSGTPTPEVAKKISNTLKRKYASGELKPTFKGRKHTEESKQKQRERHIGKKASAETKQKQSAVRKGMPGTPHTEETKTKLSEQKQGSKNVKSKLTEQNVYEIKKLLFTNELIIKDITKLFCINTSVISKMIASERWKHCFSIEDCEQLQAIQKQNKQDRVTGKNNPMFGLIGELN